MKKFIVDVSVPMCLQLEDLEVEAENPGEVKCAAIEALKNGTYSNVVLKAIEQAAEALSWNGYDAGEVMIKEVDQGIEKTARAEASDKEKTHG